MISLTQRFEIKYVKLFIMIALRVWIKEVALGDTSGFDI